jgi:hypothetical protein
MPNGGPSKRVTYLFDYFDYNLFRIKVVNALKLLLRTKRERTGWRSLGTILPIMNISSSSLHTFIFVPRRRQQQYTAIMQVLPRFETSAF